MTQERRLPVGGVSPATGRTGPAPLIVRALTVLACLAPFVWLLALVIKLGVSTPFSDEWELVPLLQKQAAGTLGIAAVWAQHNEHRQFFPELMLLKLAPATHWNIRVDMALNVVLAGGIFVLLAYLLKRTVAPHGWGTFAVAAIIFAWVAFSPRQWQNWLWGWEIAWFLLILAVVGSAAILSQWPENWSPWLGVALAAAGAVVASYSLVPGLTTWVAMGVIFYLRKHLRRGLAIWVPAAIGTLGLFFYHYMLPPGELGFAFRNPVRFALYFFAFVGSSIAGKPIPSIAAGGGVCVVFVVACGYLARSHPGELRRASAWVALAVFGFLAALMTDAGRLHFGVSESQNSRYTTLSMLIPLSTLALGLIAARCYERAERPPVPATKLATALVVVLAAGVLAVGYNLSLWRLWYQHRVLENGRTCLRTATGPTDPCLSALYPNPTIEWTRLQYLRSAGLAGLHEP